MGLTHQMVLSSGTVHNGRWPYGRRALAFRPETQEPCNGSPPYWGSDINLGKPKNKLENETKPEIVLLDATPFPIYQRPAEATHYIFIAARFAASPSKKTISSPMTDMSDAL